MTVATGGVVVHHTAFALGEHLLPGLIDVGGSPLALLVELGVFVHRRNDIVDVYLPSVVKRDRCLAYTIPRTPRSYQK